LLRLVERAADNWFTTATRTDYTRKQLIEDIKECVNVLQKFLHYWGLKQFLVPMMIYVDRYIKEIGKLGPEHIFDILFVSTVVTIKMWEDKFIRNTTFAKMFSMPTEELNVNERNFLNAVDYDLALTPEQIDQFIKDEKCVIG